MSRILPILSRALAGGILVLALSGPAAALDVSVDLGGVSADVGVGVSDGISADVGANVGGGNGIDAAATASIGGSGGGGVDADVNASVGGGNGIDAGVNAAIGGGSAVDLGVDLGIGGGQPGAPGGPGAGNGNGGITPAAIAGLSDSQLMQHRQRCYDVMANQHVHDRDLVSLCRLVIQATR